MHYGVDRFLRLKNSFEKNELNFSFSGTLIIEFSLRDMYGEEEEGEC